MWALVISAVVITIIFITKLFAGWFVSVICARIFRCNQVKIGKFGVFSLSHLKLIVCDGLSVELNTLRLKSSLVNQDYTKPLVVSVGDVRVEASLDVLTALRASRAQDHTSNETGHVGSGTDRRNRKLIKMLNWLQYMAIHIDTGQVVVMNAPSVGTIVHVAVEHATFDTYRDHSLLNLELISSMITCKVLRRNSSQSSSSSLSSSSQSSDSPSRHPAHLLNCTINLFVSIGVDFRTANLTKIETKFLNPVLVIYEGALWHARSLAMTRQQQQQSASRSTDNTSSSSSTTTTTTTGVNDNERTRWLFALGCKCVCEALALQFVAPDDRTTELTVRGLDLHSQPDSGRIELAMMDIYLTDQCASTAQVSALTCALSRNHAKSVGENAGWVCALHVDEPVSSISHADVAWWISFTRLLYDDWPRTASTSSIPSPSPLIATSTTTKSRLLTQITVEVSSLCLVFVPNQGHRIQLCVALVSFSATNNLCDIECGVESVCCCRLQDRSAVDRVQFSTHHWATPLQCAAALFKFSYYPVECNVSQATAKQDVCRINGRIEDVRLEWNLEFVSQLVNLMCSVRSGDVSATDTAMVMNGRPKSASRLIVIQMLLSQASIIVPVRNAVYVHVFGRELRFARDKSQTSARVMSVGAHYGHIQSKPVEFDTANRPIGFEVECARFEHLVAEQRLDTKDAVVEMRSDAAFVWSPELHLALYETIKASGEHLKQLVRTKAAAENVSAPTTKATPRFAFGTDHSLSVRLHVSRSHDVHFTVPQLHIQRPNQQSLTAHTHLLTVAFDGHNVIALVNFAHDQLPSHPKCYEVRQADETLTSDDNRAWSFTADKLTLWFPFRYDFAAAYDDTVNCFKWLKLVHAIKKKAFTAESRLPPDLYFAFKQTVLQLDDDPFEVKLRNNFELLFDEYQECQKRLAVLEDRLRMIQRTNPLLPNTKIMEMFEALKAKNSSIYIQRCNQMPPAHRPLFEWRMEQLEFKIAADQSLHGTDNCVRLMNKYNTETSLPAKIAFSTLWARSVELDVTAFIMHFRDYTQPYMLIDDAHFWGKVVGAESTPADRSIRDCRMHLNAPWQSVDVQRNMQPLKFYYDLNSDMARWQVTYGPCWEPCLSMINLCWNRVSPPSKDPSPPLPFWDKARQKCHGRLSMACGKLVTAMLASIDPYNETEQLEITWNNFRWDWTSGVFLIRADVDAFVRTASKYDDIRLLHLPRLKMRLDMNWVCNGDAFDHYNIVPCAPNKLPQFTQNKEHDSFRAFRSRNLNVQWHLDVKPGSDEQHDTLTTQTSDGTPQVLLYSNTLRWLNSLSHTLSMKNRPICRGALFGMARLKRTQLTRHFKHMNINVALPRFIISCWMSFSSNYGFRLHSNGLQLSSSMHLTSAPSTSQSANQSYTKLSSMNNGDHTEPTHHGTPPLKRRSQLHWSMDHMTAELAQSQITLFGDVKVVEQEGEQPIETDASDQQSASFVSSLHHPHESFFMGLNRLSYARDSLASKQLADDDQHPAVHRLTVRDLRASFTANNRDTVLAMFDGLQKNRILTRNLSTDALKMFEFMDDQAAKIKPSTAASQHATLQRSQSGHSPGRTRGQSIDGSDMLQRLIQEHDTKFIAYSETVTHEPVESLNGVALCTQDDVLQTRWHIELINSQMCLKGTETGGMVLCTAARASVYQRIHAAVWRDAQLLGKTSWTATLSGMQYYAPLFGNAFSKKRGSRGQDKTSDAQSSTPAPPEMHWLPTELVDQPVAPTSQADVTLNDTVDSFMAHSQVVGGVLAGGETSSSSSCPSSHLQLQRVISRCACQLYFCSFNDTLDFDENTPLQPQADPEPELARPGIGARVENVDTFTLKHNMLEVSTNAQQYDMILDIINHLLLFVDPKKKQSAEKLRHLRFELQQTSTEKLRPVILKHQNDVRTLLAQVRWLEKNIYFIDRRKDVEQLTEEHYEELRLLETQMEVVKTQLAEKSEHLARLISCFKEKQLQAEKQRQPVTEDQMIVIARRFEVCFEDCTWRLTDKDGQIGIAQLLIRNFLYTRISRINNSGEHLLEIGTVKVTNLLPNSKYRDVLQAQQYGMEGDVQRQCVRVVCRDMAPVGGISVKEHFEINVSPMVVQITYGFFRAIMKYFFPDKNIDKADQQMLDMADDEGKPAVVTAAAEKMNKITTPKTDKKAKRSKKASQAALSDEIEKMKERAEKNIMFLYIKIPEVPFTVSYKGSKEKNIEDVENFNLMFPLVEYHDRNWTWLDLALAIKQRCKRVLLQQFMKQKLLRNRRGAGGQQPGEMQLGEEEKIRLVLGNMVVMGSEKSSKSSSLHK